MASERGRGAGKVFLVGAGPGDPGLITLRGASCLARADVVLYDYLVNPALLVNAPHARHVCLGRHGHSRLWTQDEINSELLALARQGQCVVRLKGGDPAVFARGAEEAEYLARHGISFEMVPGITAAIAAASYAAIPITHRDHASAVALVTGQERSDLITSTLDYDALARFPGTLVFYMGVTTAPDWSARLIQAGKSSQTPVALVRRCSLPDQQTLHTTLADLPQLLESQRMRPPVVIVVGAVAQPADAALAWFEHRPLFGRRILVTRPRDQAPALVALLEELGAEVLVQPAIEIGPPDSWTPLDEALGRLERHDWIVFSSANGVRYCLDRLLAMGRDMRALSRSRLAVIGPGTAAELERYSLRADLQPTSFVAEQLAAELEPLAAGQRFLLIRASRGREVLAQRLSAAGGHVEQVVAYSSRDVTEPDPEIATRLAEGRIDWVTVTSSAIARSLVQLFGDGLRRTRLASISPITSATLEQLGYPPAAEAQRQTMDGVVDAIAAA